MKNPTAGQSGLNERLPRRKLFLAAGGAAGMAALQVSAQTPAATPAAPAQVKIGIIQAIVALGKTKEGQAAQAELEKKLGPKAQSIQKDQADLNELQRKLDQGGNTMSAAAKQELQNTIQTKSKTVQRNIQDFQDEQQSEEGKVVAGLEEKMKAVIDKYAAENGFTIIFNVADENTPVLWAANSIDITNAIVDAYDRAAPATPVAPKTPAASRPAATPPPAASRPAATLPPAAAPKPSTSTPSAPKQ